MKISRTLTAASFLFAGWQLDVLSAFAAGGSGKSEPDQAIITFVVFVLLLLVLYLMAWKPLMAGLAQREKSIADMIDDAKRSSDEATKKLEGYEQKLAAAAVEAREIVAKARTDGNVAGEKMLADARAAAQRESERALSDIEAAKNAAVQEIADQSANTAFSLARNLIEERLDPSDHSALISESLQQFPSEN